jgi:hypothetical protein
MAITVYTGVNDVARVTVTNASSNTTITINKPANVVDGDLMLLKIAQNDTLNPSSIALSDSTYWGAAINENFGVNGATACHTAYYKKQWSTGDATSWTATIGASTLDDESFVFRVTGHDPVTPIDVAAGSQNSTQSTGPVSPSVTTLTDGAVVIYGVSAKNGSVLTAEDLGNPIGTTLIQNKRSRNASGGVNSGLAYELRATAGATGTRTWLAYTSTAQYHSAYSFAIRPSIAAAISGVNGGADTAAYGEACTWTTTDFSPAANAATVDGVDCSAVSGSGFTMPALVDETIVPLPGTQQLTGTNGTQSANRNITVTAPSGMTSQLLSGTIDTSGDGSVLIGFDPAAVADDYILYPTAGNTSVNSAGQLQTDIAGTIEMWHIKASTGVARSFNVITGVGGVITGIISTGLISQGIESIGI